MAIMKLLSSSRDRLLKRLKEFAYRHAWAEAHVTNGIAFQLRAMRKARGWDQEQLAQKAFGNPKLQSLISRYENPDYGKYSLSTLFDFARAFDVVLQVRYAPFSELIKWEEDLPSADLNVPSFAEQMQTDVLAKDSPRAPILVRGRGARRGRIGHRAPLIASQQMELDLDFAQAVKNQTATGSGTPKIDPPGAARYNRMGTENEIAVAQDEQMPEFNQSTAEIAVLADFVKNQSAGAREWRIQ